MMVNSFFDQVTSLIDYENIVDKVQLDFSKAFNKVHAD